MSNREIRTEESLCSEIGQNEVIETTNWRAAKTRSEADKLFVGIRAGIQSITTVVISLKIKKIRSFKDTFARGEFIVVQPE